MGVRIFENASYDNQQESKSDVVGRFRSGQQVNGRPMGLKTWRITTGDPAVAEKVAELYGGEVAEWDTKSDEKLEVITDTADVAVLVQNITTEMVLWGKKGKIRSCDGVTQKDEERSPCVCPSDMGERMKGAKNGTSCEPSAGIYFSLADAPDLGVFRFYSSSWGILRNFSEAEAQLDGLREDRSEKVGGRFSLVGKTNKDGMSYTVASIVLEQELEAF